MIEPSRSRQLTNNSDVTEDCSPLRLAIEDDHIEGVQSVLDIPGLDVNLLEKEYLRREEMWRSALDVAVTGRNETTVSLLCEAGADVNCPNSLGQTPFHTACHQGEVRLVRLLLKWSADVNLCDDSGKTPLCIAAGNDHKEVLEELLRSGGDPNKAGVPVKDLKRCSHPLHIAAHQGHSDIVDILCKQKGIRIDQLDGVLKTPLMYGCEAGNIRVVQTLLSAGASVNRRDKHGRVPLAHVLFSNMRPILRHQDTDLFVSNKHSAETLAVLMETGANPNVPDNFGLTAAQYSVMLAGQWNLAVLFFYHGAEMLSKRLQPNLLADWTDLANVKRLAELSPEFRPFAEKVLREYSKRLSEAERGSLRKCLRAPSRLKDMCRCVIRLCLQTNTESSIFPLTERLPLPTFLQQFLRYENS
ncbi:ankyrin repeat and SOCS box protein 10-like [Liolophura sinensis]|uniref:ankyrin repeat and SOCS box protein 10-like n=1 Tax=Liolophura sinensis TaxID=3198878 RepID=UPI00315960F6